MESYIQLFDRNIDLLAHRPICRTNRIPKRAASAHIFFILPNETHPVPRKSSVDARRMRIHLRCPTNRSGACAPYFARQIAQAHAHPLISSVTNRPAACAHCYFAVRVAQAHVRTLLCLTNRPVACAYLTFRANRPGACAYLYLATQNSKARLNVVLPYKSPRRMRILFLCRRIQPGACA